MKEKKEKKEEIIECINPKNINNITLTKGYKKIYKYLGISHFYEAEDTGEILDEKELTDRIRTEIELGHIYADSGIANTVMVLANTVILYYNTFITIKYNDCCNQIILGSEKNIYFTKYNEALEYFDKLNEKLGFMLINKR